MWWEWKVGGWRGVGREWEWERAGGGVDFDDMEVDVGLL